MTWCRAALHKCQSQLHSTLRVGQKRPSYVEDGHPWTPRRTELIEFASNLKMNTFFFYWQALKEKRNDWDFKNHNKWREPKAEQWPWELRPGQLEGPCPVERGTEVAAKCWNLKDCPFWVEKPHLPAQERVKDTWASLSWLSTVGLQANLHHNVGGTQCCTPSQLPEA